MEMQMAGEERRASAADLRDAKQCGNFCRRVAMVGFGLSID
jgi:hypothetical protein